MADNYDTRSTPTGQVCPQTGRRRA